MIAFGLMTLAATSAGTLTDLMVLRFFAGIGLGAAAPGALALSADSCRCGGVPWRFR